MEQEIARIASKERGVVTREELLIAGCSGDEIDHRLRIGVLHREFRGVYRAGHRAPSVGARYLAAVKACGEGAALSGTAAGHYLGLLKGSPPPEVTAPTERRLKGVRTRRRRLERAEVVVVRGIPVTSVPRTLVDLAAVLDEEALARACHEAGVRYRTTPSRVQAVLARHPRAPGAARLRRVMSGDAKVLLSKLERAFIALLRRAGLPLPETNRHAGAHYVDCRWPAHRLTVELDSYTFHNSRHSWERDRAREREARRRGDELRRFTYDDVFVRGVETATDVGRLLRL